MWFSTASDRVIMTEINLLPWREQKREQAKKQFTVYAAAVFFLSILLVIFANYYVLGKIDTQAAINVRLQNEINEYKKRIVAIKHLKKLRQGLIARMEIIHDLQATRILTVRLLDELIHILPDGVYVTKMERAGDKITLTGYTESNSNISLLMRNIQLSHWIQLPELTEIKKTKEESESSPNEFKLSFILKPKKAPH